MSLPSGPRISMSAATSSAAAACTRASAACFAESKTFCLETTGVVASPRPARTRPIARAAAKLARTGRSCLITLFMFALPLSPPPAAASHAAHAPAAPRARAPRPASAPGRSPERGAPERAARPAAGRDIAAADAARASGRAEVRGPATVETALPLTRLRRARAGRSAVLVRCRPVFVGRAAALLRVVLPAAVAAPVDVVLPVVVVDEVVVVVDVDRVVAAVPPAVPAPASADADADRDADSESDPRAAVVRRVVERGIRVVHRPPDHRRAVGRDVDRLRGRRLDLDDGLVLHC